MLIGNAYILLKSSLSSQTKYIQPNTYRYKANGLISTQMSLQIHFVTHYNYTPVYIHNADWKCFTFKCHLNVLCVTYHTQ